MRCAQAIRDMLFRNLECKRFWQCENDKTSVAWIGECPSALHAGPRVKRGLSDELKKIRSRGCLFPRVIDALQGQEAVTVMTNSNAAFQNVRRLCYTFSIDSVLSLNPRLDSYQEFLCPQFNDRLHDRPDLHRSNRSLFQGYIS